MKRLNYIFVTGLVSTTCFFSNANSDTTQTPQSIDYDSLRVNRIMIEDKSNLKKEVTVSLPSYLDCTERTSLEVIDLGVGSYPIGWTFETEPTQEVIVIKRENFSAVESTCFEQYEFKPTVKISMLTEVMHLLLIGVNKNEYTLETIYK